MRGRVGNRRAWIALAAAVVTVLAFCGAQRGVAVATAAPSVSAKVAPAPRHSTDRSQSATLVVTAALALACVAVVWRRPSRRFHLLDLRNAAPRGPPVRNLNG